MKNKLKDIIRVIVRGGILLWCKIAHRVKIEGREDIPKDGALIFCGNHRTFLDPPLIVVTAKRHVHFLAKEELYKNPFLAFLGWSFDAIKVKRDAKDINAVKSSLKYLKKGECIALFPEGTRNGLAKGEKVKDGAAFFAVRTGAKVLPIGINGGVKPFRRTVITYGKPLDYSMYKGQDKDKEVLEKVTEDIMENIIELSK